ncbi:FtsK/SpoIIIE domain-containing protein [Sporolactobacillus kofuensis]|uniref:FtsK/SpoIIIE domain-containing protein n=1 Tax=Sporolactobacillus kofuensis TaxID=269672 RepID=A0ABW1WCA2_9BACL|nr:FtsK/SpoIIIE domain-containing protein [Sporolactobacillus kofuensis]MCO7175575.1 FtsK/SpoIIIE domain-containing protein [Sporolactobacillus kofuensis]
MIFLKWDPYYKRLRHCFRAAGLCRQWTIGNNTYEVRPTIHAVQRKLSETILTFTLPTGMDPSSVKKCDYAFKQEFGRNTVVVGDLKKFTVHIYRHSMPAAIKYKPDDVKTAIGDMAIPIIAGYDQTASLIAYDMRKHPHLLIAGETGYGKSTELRAVLTTLMICRPSVRFILGDLKRSEFHVFRNCEPVDALCTDAGQLSIALDKVMSELEKRGKLLDDKGLTSTAETDLPDIIVAIDEVALLKKEKKIMAAIEDISAIGRALGVYLILSMQRPDAQVLDGKLKNNLTVRISYKQADKVNSRIVLGDSGAEDLTHPGRGLLKIMDTRAVQSPYLDVARARTLLDPIRTRVDDGLSEIVPEQEPKQLFDLLGGADDA